MKVAIILVCFLLLHDKSFWEQDGIQTYMAMCSCGYFFFFFFYLSLNPNCAKMCYFLILCRRVEIFIFSIFLSWESKENQHVFYKVLKWINLTWSMAIISATYKLFIYIMGGHWVMWIFFIFEWYNTQTKGMVKRCWIALVPPIKMMLKSEKK